MKKRYFVFPILFLFLNSTSGYAQSLSNLRVPVHYRFNGSLEDVIEGMALEFSDERNLSRNFQRIFLSAENTFKHMINKFIYK